MKTFQKIFFQIYVSVAMHSYCSLLCAGYTLPIAKKLHTVVQSFTLLICYQCLIAVSVAATMPCYCTAW